MCKIYSDYLLVFTLKYIYIPLMSQHFPIQPAVELVPLAGWHAKEWIDAKSRNN